jgi:hypothetical protein
VTIGRHSLDALFDALLRRTIMHSIWSEDRPMADPDVVTHGDRMRAAPSEEFRFVSLVRPIAAGPIGEMGMARALHRVVAGIDAHVGAIEQNLPIVVWMMISVCENQATSP